MASTPSDADLLSYADELLPVEQAAIVESQLRDSPDLRDRVAGLLDQRDEGVHTLADIWRRNRLSCPNRARLGQYLMQTLPSDEQLSIEVHLNDVQCRLCNAEVEDLVARRTDGDRRQRHERIFESSIGLSRRTD